MTRMVLAANAVLGLGGQGANLEQLVQGLREDLALTVFARHAVPGLLGEGVPRSRAAGWIQRGPLLRRLRDLSTLLEERHFDRYVARRLPAADLFQGVTGQCAESLRVARRAGARTVLDSVTMHIEQFATAARAECARFGVRFPIAGPLARRMIREYQDADLIRVMSERARKTFLERGVAPDRVFTIFPHLALDRFPAATFTGSPFRVSVAGGLEPWKGFHYAIDAFRAFPARDAEMILWGGFTSRPVSRYLHRALAADRRLSLRPFAGHAEVYASAHVLVHPSVSDGVATVVIEAMACGLPVVVSDATGAADLIEDGRNGYVVPVRDPAAITDRLVRLAASPGLVRSMGAAARQSVGLLTLERFRREYTARLRPLL